MVLFWGRDLKQPRQRDDCWPGIGTPVPHLSGGIVQKPPAKASPGRSQSSWNLRGPHVNSVSVTLVVTCSPVGGVLMVICGLCVHLSFLLGWKGEGSAGAPSPRACQVGL